MKITKDTLKKMDFEVTVDDQYRLILKSDIGSMSIARLKKNTDGPWDFRIGDGPQHSVTDVEELAFFAYRDGVEAGIEEAQETIRGALGIKEAESHFCACCTRIGGN
jgi:hypothetical protein